MLMELTKPWLPQTSRIWFRKPHWCVRANHFVSKAAVETAAIKIVFVTVLGHWTQNHGENPKVTPTVS